MGAGLGFTAIAGIIGSEMEPLASRSASNGPPSFSANEITVFVGFLTGTLVIEVATFIQTPVV